MKAIRWTTTQRQGIETVDRGVLVSAAAGSGKTAVLAERCAYLVCDAPAPFRCDVDQLLVLTFTDAAAAEMRERIVQAIRGRCADRPEDRRLREQLALVEAAQISTIHSFCLWLVRRGFSELGVDPTATLLDAEEATLLREDVLQDLFGRLYEREPVCTGLLGQASAGSDEAGAGAATSERSGELERAARDLARLVEDYGLGEDAAIGRFVLRLHAFTVSLPDPRAWLKEAIARVSARAGHAVADYFAHLWAEVQMQGEACRRAAEEMMSMPPPCHGFALAAQEYVDRLRGWWGALQSAFRAAGMATLESCREIDGLNDERVAAVLRGCEAIRAEIAAFPFDVPRAAALPRDCDPALRAARDEASRRCREEIRDGLFKKRLRDGYTRFSTEELLSGLRRTEPFVRTLVELVRRFDVDYEQKKRRLDVMDFADLERLAYRLLSDEGDPQRPSPTALALRDRFAHVLVDEYQDINPLQEAILRRVSREDEMDRPANFFAVGDVKQSIYRFRLAEPGLFLERQVALMDAETAEGGGGASSPDVPARGRLITLQQNFRSRREIVEAINLTFERLMRESTCGLAYDDTARLFAARVEEKSCFFEVRTPVELHLLDRRFRPEPAEGGEGAIEESDLGRWSVIEREAYRIATRIHELRREAVQRELSPPAFRDMAILLRAARVNAEQMAAVLMRMGVPAMADVGGSLFDAVEVRDVLAALAVFDNPRQDVPLAAVMRGGVLGEDFGEDDLVAIRSLNRSIAFHECVAKYADEGLDETLRGRVVSLWNHVRVLRARARRRPLAELLWTLYDDYGQLGRAETMSNGPQRRANLLKLHDLSRRFGTFRRQGLHRFLRFVESLRSEGGELAAAPTLGPAEDVVRILSIHQSKGLEFPVVFIAGLGTKFNLMDRSGMMIFERRAHIGLKVADAERMVTYPTAAHRLAAEEIEQTAREEEMRVLYVGMTRARNRLILVGSVSDAEERAAALTAECRSMEPPLDLEVRTARTPLDWVLGALSSAPAGRVTVTLASDGVGRMPAGESEELALQAFAYGEEEMSAWTAAPATSERGAAALRAAVARCEALPPSEPFQADGPEVVDVLKRMDWVYPTLSSAVTRAAVAASEIKGELDFTRSPDERLAEATGSDRTGDGWAEGKPAGMEEAARRGIATHRLLQHLEFRGARQAQGLASELHRLEAEGLLRQEDVQRVDLDAVRWLLADALAERIARAGAGYRRELSFIALEPAALFDPTLPPATDDRVLVRGIVDGVLADGAAVEIVDFKTDAVSPEAVDVRAARYRPQMVLYARAMERLFRRPVRDAWLVFLAPRRIIRWNDPARLAASAAAIDES